jgi:hypothetical protein
MTRPQLNDMFTLSYLTNNIIVVIVGAGVVERMGGDPCRRPRPFIVIIVRAETPAVALGPLLLPML